MPHHPTQKNIIHGSIHANGNVHIGDIIYNIARDFKSGSILFLRLDKKDHTHYTANLSVKSKHSDQGSLATSGEKWCENIELNISLELFEALNEFQTFRRGIDTQMRLTGLRSMNPSSVIALENQLSQLIFDTFFANDIGKACTAFIQQLEEQRIDELLLTISTDDENIVNLPFEMALPLLFPPKLGEAKKSLAISNFGLVRTKISSLEAFNLQGDHASAAPLKMLFITALPENLDERGKMLQIEEEQTRLIRAIGALEATGDKQPKIVIEFLENASLAELDKALHARQHDIVHISGHGAYHAAQNKGVLYFENEDGDEEQVSGAALGETLRKHACVKVLILSACETAIAGSEGGVTEQVAAYGIPSIVAMRFAVTDEGAKVFTTELYTQLAKGLTLTRALAYAREELLKDITQRRERNPDILHIAEWFTPVVYQNQAVNALINKTQPYHLPDHFYPFSSFLKTKQSRLIGEGFIGRKRYLIQMLRAFRSGRHICLHGLGGLGKTTLAEAFTHNYASHENGEVIIFRNGSQINEKYILDEFFARIEDSNANNSFIRQIKAQLDDPNTDVIDKLQLLISNYLTGRNIILIFDNVEDVQTDEGGDYQRRIVSVNLSSFLRYLCENSPANCHILFTTRYKIEDLSDVVEHIALDKMSYAEQYRLLNYSVVLRNISLKDREEVYRRLDGHPRGYEFFESLLKKDKTFTWQQVAQSEEKVLENLLLAKVYDRLSEQEKTIFQIAAVFITRTPLAALATVTNAEEAALLSVLQALQDWSLCFLEKDGRFEVHRLTREWMAQQVIDPTKLKEWALQAGEYFQAQPTWDDEILAKNYFEVAEAWAQFAETTFHILDHYELIGLYSQAFELSQAVLAKNIDDKTNADALNYNGVMLISVSDYDTALHYLEQSLAIRQQIGDRKGEGATLNNISQIYDAKGDYDSALRYLEQSLTIAQQIGDRKGQGTALNNISQIYDARGDYDTAVRYLEQSLAIQQQIGDRQGESYSFLNFSKIYLAKEDYDIAFHYLEQSLAISQQVGDRKAEGTAFNNLAIIAKAKNDYNKALSYLEQSLAIYQQIGYHNGVRTTLKHFSEIYSDKGDYDTALQHLKLSLAISQQIGDSKKEGATLINLATTAHNKGDYDIALQYFKQSLAIQQQIGDHEGEGVSLNNIGQIYSAKEDYDKALSYLEHSLAIFQQIGDSKGEGTALDNISKIFYAKGDYDTAVRYLEQSLAIYKQIGNRQNEGTILNNMSVIYYSKGDYERTSYYLEQCLAIQQEIDDKAGLATTLINIGEIYLNKIFDLERATVAFGISYNISQRLGLPNLKHAAANIQKIIDRIGLAKFQEILSKNGVDISDFKN